MTCSALLTQIWEVSYKIELDLGETNPKSLAILLCPPVPPFYLMFAVTDPSFPLSCYCFTSCSRVAVVQCNGPAINAMQSYFTYYYQGKVSFNSSGIGIVFKVLFKMRLS